MNPVAMKFKLYCVDATSVRPDVRRGGTKASRLHFFLSYHRRSYELKKLTTKRLTVEIFFENKRFIFANICPFTQHVPKRRAESIRLFTFSQFKISFQSRTEFLRGESVEAMTNILSIKVKWLHKNLLLRLKIDLFFRI